MRTYKKKTDRGSASLDQLKKAAESVIHQKQSVRSAAKQFEVKRNTLMRFITKFKEQKENATMGYKTPRQVFSTEQEQEMNKYLLQLAAIFFGLAPRDVRRLAYDCAVEYKLKMPDAWITNKMAGKDWMTAFLKRNPRLSIRKPEATSLGRATSFNKTNIKAFFDKLGNVMDRHKFTASTIYNTDETGVSTVLKPNKIVAAKGKRNVGSMTSAERGTNVTVLTAVSASGNTIPPMFVFPRKRYKDHFISGGPPDCIGIGNASGWITDEEFYIFMKHFIKYVKPTVDYPVLLLLDNHSSHLAIKTVNLAKTSGVIMLSFPPHCTHRLQPLDVSVFGPFKKYLASAQDGWLRSNAGKTMTIYDIPKIVATALPLATTANNIINGFKKTGIFPFNADIFTESDFAPSYVTDRPEVMSDTFQVESPEISTPSASAVHVIPTTGKENVSPNINNNPVASTSRSGVYFSPETVRPFPKAGPRKQLQTARKKRRAAILTDTPEKDSLAQEQSKKQKTGIDKAKKKAIKKKVFTLSDSSSDNCEEYACLICDESYSESIPGEEWVRCHACLKWAHQKCTSGTISMYICVNCDSDID